jgi:hypothetical protein
LGKRIKQINKSPAIPGVGGNIMMLHEFTDKVVAIDPEYKMFTKTDYDIIELVYMYYPGIKDKEAIAKIYVDHGMVLINDMAPRAIKIRDLEDKIQLQQNALNKLKSDLENLK